MFIVFIFISIYIFFFTRISFFKYDNFLFGDFDLAHHAQEIWSILHGSLDCSILGLKFLGNHVHIIEFLLSPFYALFPSPKTLLFLQTLFLGLGAWPLYLIAQKKLANRRIALAVSFSYLIYPALGYVNLFEFHPQALAVFFILFTFYFFEQENMPAFLIFMFLSLICQENISLVIIAFGFYALLSKRKAKWALIPLAAGIVWFFLCISLILPNFNKGEVGFYNIYGHLGRNLWEIASNILLHPFKITRYLLTRQNAVYLFQLLAPVAFLPLLSQGILLFFIPPLLQHLLSQRASEHTIYYQYTIEIIPFIFIGMVYGLKRILDNIRILNKHKEKLIAGIIAFALLFNFILGPHFSILALKANFKMKTLSAEKKRLVNFLPPNASVVATFDFLSHLAHRQKLYSFHHLYIGKHTLSNKDYILPADTEYALVNFNDPLTFQGFYTPKGDITIRNFLQVGDWGVVEAVENIILFKRNYNSTLYTYRILKNDAKDNSYLTLDNGEIAFFNYDTQLTTINNRRYIKFKINYQCLKPINKNYCLAIQIIDQRKQIVYNSIHPINYGIYPTSRWEKGQVIEEVFNLPLAGQFKAGTYTVIIAVFDSFTGQVGLLNNSANYFEAGKIVIMKN